MSEEMVQVLIPKKIVEWIQKELDILAEESDIPEEERYTAVEYIEEMGIDVLMDICNPYEYEG